MAGGIAVCGMLPFNVPIGPYYPAEGSDDTVPGLLINGTNENPVQIKNNSADGWSDYTVGGGGILLYHLKDANQAEISNAEISGNTVTNGPGGGIESLYLSRGYQNNLTVDAAALTGNRAADGGGVCLSNATKAGVMNANLSNTVITGNSAAKLGGGISVEAESSSTGNTVLTFGERCAVYDNTADLGADDFYKKKNLR